MTSYADGIRSGEVAPWSQDYTAERDNALASSQICSDELTTMAYDDPQRPEIEAQRAAWQAHARVLAMSAKRA